MATWTDIDDTRLEPGKPIRSVDGLALRDNPIAITEGAAGAPRIQEAALANGVASNRVLANGAVTAQKLAAGVNETTWVLGRNAGASVGAVGTYALLFKTSSSAANPGSVFGGSELRYSSAAADSGGIPSGSWRCMGYVPNNSGASGVTLWLRVA